jgi:hypothetical protein
MMPVISERLQLKLLAQQQQQQELLKQQEQIEETRRKKADLKQEQQDEREEVNNHRRKRSNNKSTAISRKKRNSISNAGDNDEVGEQKKGKVEKIEEEPVMIKLKVRGRQSEKRKRFIYKKNKMTVNSSVSTTTTSSLTHRNSSSNLDMVAADDSGAIAATPSATSVSSSQSCSLPSVASSHFSEACRSEDRVVMAALITTLQSNNTDQEPAQSSVDGEFPRGTFAVGNVVRVVNRTVPGKKEQEGGTAKVLCRRWNEETQDVRYDVQYILRKRVERDIPAKYVHVEGLSVTNDRDVLSALTVRDVDAPMQASSKWVRRSVRHPGTDQLIRPNVRDLLDRLQRDDPNDADMVVLRVKNWLPSDTNSQVITRVFELVGKSKVIQALYVQNMEDAMNDETLLALSKALEENQRIWALNVGENFRITPKGWRRFAEDLKKTGITHIYAGSETTVNDDLKIKIRDVVRDNRAKHDLHISRSNLHVIWQIGQMWWNPKNSKVVQDYKQEELANDFTLGERVVLKQEDTSSSPSRFYWVFGSVVKVGERCKRELEFANSKRKWLDLFDPKLSCSCKNEMVLASTEKNEWWPAMLFTESSVFVFIRIDSMGELTFEVDDSHHEIKPFLVDEASPAARESAEEARKYYWK